MVGSPATVRDQLISQANELGTNNVLMWASFGDLTREQTLASFKLIGEHVIPALRETSLVAA